MILGDFSLVLFGVEGDKLGVLMRDFGGFGDKLGGVLISLPDLVVIVMIFFLRDYINKLGI